MTFEDWQKLHHSKTPLFLNPKEIWNAATAAERDRCAGIAKEVGNLKLSRFEWMVCSEEIYKKITQKKTLMKTQARIKPDAFVMHDHRVFHWSADHPAANTVFEAEWVGNCWECRTDGYGRRPWVGEQGEYGSGSVYVFDKDGIIKEAQ